MVLVTGPCKKALLMSRAINFRFGNEFVPRHVEAVLELGKEVASCRQWWSACVKILSCFAPCELLGDKPTPDLVACQYKSIVFRRSPWPFRLASDLGTRSQTCIFCIQSSSSFTTLLDQSQVK